jgi:hypothetical protein
MLYKNSHYMPLLKTVRQLILDCADPAVAALTTSFIVFAAVILPLNLTTDINQEFGALASSFIEGHTYLMDPILQNDVAPFAGRTYWPGGFLPALLLVPFTAIFRALGFMPLQGHLAILMTAGVIVTWYHIARLLKFSKLDSLYLTFAFLAASPYIGVALFAYSWYLASVVTTFFLSLALHEFLTRNRPIVIGLCLGAVMLTRPTASLAVLLFLISILNANAKWQEKVKQLATLGVPLLLSLVIYFIYNYLRFGNPLEMGYSYAQLAEPLARARDYGLFSLVHLPSNLYYFLLSGPLPVFRDNVSAVLVAPYLKPTHGA